MKVGFNLLLWTTHLTENLRPVLKALKAAGYDGVEVPIFGGDPAYYRGMRAMLDGEGLQSTVVAVVQSPDANPMSLDPASHGAGIDYLRGLIDCAVALGAEVICGPLTQPLATFSGTGPSEREWANLVTASKAMAAHAGSAITIAVEPLNRFECYALNTAAQAARLVREVDHPSYGYLYDTFHANIEERQPLGALAATIDAVKHIHISENDRGTPGRGHAAIRETLALLQGQGYDGWLTVEAFGQALPDLAAATRVWRPLFGSEREVYEEAIALIRKGWN
jgi:D-psicose/D-tagatose/L-ribulose 3-epimerase